MRRKLLFILLFVPTCYISAQEICDSVRIRFEQSKSNIDFSLNDNKEKLNKIISRLNENKSDSLLDLQKVFVIGSASPEGSAKINRKLSEQRSQVLFDYINSFYPLPDSKKEFLYLGRDWKGLLAMVKADSDVPYRDESIALIEKIIEQVEGGVSNEQQITMLKKLRWGVPYWYMYQNLFPALRESKLYVWYDKKQPQPIEKQAQPIAEAKTETEQAVEVAVDVTETKMCRPFYMNIRTNLLYDALAVPNVGAEFYIGKNFSAGGNWAYSWWSNNSKHRFWRIYGGALFLRKWLGKAAHAKPLTGHHVGVYAMALTYDIEWGGKGYLGGKPEGNIFNNPTIGVGLEYGYSLPIAKRLNLDFSLGLGYLSGKYYEYKPLDGCYVWQSTHKRNWYGPSKAEISLVWLIGCDNYNRKKGGKR